jgi:hypothetical protein
MSKRQARAELRAKIKGMAERGEPIHVRLVRVARSQMSLRGVLPRFMVRAGEFMFSMPEDAVLQCYGGVEIHDTWRPVRGLDTTVVFTRAGDACTPPARLVHVSSLDDLAGIAVAS